MAAKGGGIFNYIKNHGHTRAQYYNLSLYKYMSSISWPSLFMNTTALKKDVLASWRQSLNWEAVPAENCRLLGHPQQSTAPWEVYKKDIN